jgi:curli biogenesis system outer membrane secretion channel CsgG
VTSDTAGKVGGSEGADYLIYGSMTSASVVTKNLFGMRPSPIRVIPMSVSMAVTLAIDIKITDARSGEVRYTSNINQTEKAGPPA